jgi:hypothetical protein
VADAPERADPRRMADAALATDHGGDSDNVVSIRCVTHAEQKPQQDDG